MTSVSMWHDLTWHDLACHGVAPHDNAFHDVAHDRLSLTVGEERRISSQRLLSLGTPGDRFRRGALEAEDWVLYKKQVVK